MDDEFLSTAYPKVYENLKLITDERVFDDKPESHSGSMSSMKNLDDSFNFGDQFLHDKPTEDDQERSKVREESDSTIPDSSHQTVTLHSSIDLLRLSQMIEGKDSDMEDTAKAHIPEVSTTTWFKPIPESEETCNTDPEMDQIPPNDISNQNKTGQDTYCHKRLKRTGEKQTSKERRMILDFVHQNVLRRTGKKKLCKADLEGPAFNLISEKDFKNLHPNDFEDLFLLNIQEKLPNSAQDRQDQSSHSSQHVDKKPGDQESCGRLTARD
ncbi:hypothetical protein Tco_1015996 [Tanacetum coccineum]|uniref:Uncharacterized protein n=1 Tax=Tanacetum coccineum TaxID=301880 RepID=A0ABQ5FMI3_9ASTR